MEKSLSLKAKRKQQEIKNNKIGGGGKGETLGGM